MQVMHALTCMSHIGFDGNIAGTSCAGIPFSPIEQHSTHQMHRSAATRVLAPHEPNNHAWTQTPGASIVYRIERTIVLHKGLSARKKFWFCW
eukprot:m.545554 g.545554  ORF g.545554 m.545554 type:complete len:92 (-) comp22147_c0_seq17:887-1162(-)